MKKLGKVIEVFLPQDEELTKIGFKIQIDNQIITIIEKQTSENAKMYRNDFLFLEIINENNQIKYNIKPLNEENIDLGEDDE